MRGMSEPRSKSDIDARELAALWFALAEASDLDGLSHALQVAKRRIEAAREAMRREPARYTAFQAALVGGLQSPRPRLRFECAHALDIFGDASTRAPLVALMTDPTPRVRWMAMHALSCHACGEKPDALEADIRVRIGEAARADPSPTVRRHAATALSFADKGHAAAL
jgi:hypothetical protein